MAKRLASGAAAATQPRRKGSKRGRAHCRACNRRESEHTRRSGSIELQQNVSSLPQQISPDPLCDLRQQICLLGFSVHPAPLLSARRREHKGIQSGLAPHARARPRHHLLAHRGRERGGGRQRLGRRVLRGGQPERALRGERGSG